jgi:hypothetical protein
MSLSFQKVDAAPRYAKVLLIGEAGTGKSHAALTFPKPAVIDAEGSAAWFADRFEYVAVPTKSYSEVRDLIRKVIAGQVPCETLVIDSLTSIYNGLLNATAAQREDFRPIDWGRIKRKFSQVLDELYVEVPMHVVCTGWIKPEYAKAGTVVNGKTVSSNDLVVLGEMFDGDKKVAYAFDFIIKIVGNDGKKARAVVLKSRSGKLKAGQEIADFSWKTLAPLLSSAGGSYRGMTDAEQTARDRDAVASEGGAPAQDAAPVPPTAANAKPALRGREDVPADLWEPIKAQGWLFGRVRAEFEKAEGDWDRVRSALKAASEVPVRGGAAQTTGDAPKTPPAQAEAPKTTAPAPPGLDSTCVACGWTGGRHVATCPEDPAGAPADLAFNLK